MPTINESVCVFPHQRSSARGVASMAPQYHCCQSAKIPFPMRTKFNNRQLLEKPITLERKGIFTITTFC